MILMLVRCGSCRNLVKRRDDDGTLYDWCGKIIDSPDKDRERDCKYYQHASNADRIRSMTDEELAGQIAEWNHGDCPPIELCPKRRNEVSHYIECAPWKCWLDWLKKEAE